MRNYVSSRDRSSSRLSSDTSDLRLMVCWADGRGDETLLEGGGIAVLGVRADI